MSLARAFTKRYKAGQQPEETAQILPARAMTVKRFDKPIDRAQISLPIELISTTNVLALEAPDIHPNTLNSPLTAPSSAASFKSYDSDNARSSASSMTMPDLSRESSPTVSEPKPSSYFPATSAKAPSTSSVPAAPQVSSFQEKNAPSVPSRALSHTKKTHQALAHKRSMRLSNNSDNAVPPPALSPSKASKTASIELPIQSNSVPEPLEHPFGAELAQVKEVAEDFGVQIWDEEEQFLLEHGLSKYGAEDYMVEIQPLFGKVFGDVPYSPTSWL